MILLKITRILCTKLIIVVLFVIAKYQQKTEVLYIGMCINWYIHTMEYYEAIKKNEVIFYELM